MTTGSEYLATFVRQASQYAPSITVSHLQRNERPPGSRNWKPGIGGYGWGINGRVVNDANGSPAGLQFGVSMWFSDRRTNPSASPPEWQQFSARAKDDQRITVMPSGTDVNSTIVLLRWGNATFFDDQSCVRSGKRTAAFRNTRRGPCRFASGHGDRTAHIRHIRLPVTL
jgi:hypothetical protein